MTPDPAPASAARGRAWLADGAIAALLTLWYYRYGLTHLSSRMYDDFDQKAMVYVLEWLRRCTVGAGHLRELFDLPMLYPERNVLAWSDTMLGYLPVYGLARAFTAEPRLALNAVALAFTFGAALGMARFGRALTGRQAWVAPAAGAVGLVTCSQEMHLQMKGLAPLVWSLLALLHFARGRRWALAAFVALAGWTFLCSIYFGVMLAVLVTTGAAIGLAAGRARFVRWAWERLRSSSPLATGAAAALTAVPVGWVAVHYLRVKGQFGGYDLETFVPYSGRLGSLADASPASLVYRSVYGDWGSHEARLAFGLVVWLGALALAVGWRRWALDRAERRVLGALACCVALCTVLALGPWLREGLAAGVRIPLPAQLYARFFPGFVALRTAGRWAFPAVLALSLLAEVGLRQLAGLLGRQRLGYALLAGLVLIEQTSNLRPRPVELYPRRAVYEGVRANTPPDAVVLELPIERSGWLPTVSWWHEQMLGSTLHWRRIPVGFTSLESPTVARLKAALAAFEGDALSPGEFADALRSTGVTHVVLDRTLVASATAARLERGWAALGCPGRPVGDSSLIFALDAVR